MTTTAAQLRTLLLLTRFTAKTKVFLTKSSSSGSSWSSCHPNSVLGYSDLQALTEISVSTQVSVYKMSQSLAETPVEKWTKEDVHQWLMTEVKVHQSCADRFTEEDVSGECLILFEKKDILDLEVKHGPAVKITSYLKKLKEGSQHELQFPVYVDNWTKEQVSQWLLQHVKIYSKYAERLQEEEVSGDCLVCFSKQDLLDLEIKSGPAVKILAGLRQLNNKPEPILNPTLHTSIVQDEALKPAQTRQSPAQSQETKQPRDKTDVDKKDKVVEEESEKSQLWLEKASEREEVKQPRPQSSGPKRKETTVTTVLPDIPKTTVEIQKTLENLTREDLKTFQFYLGEYGEPWHERIPKGKLEDKDTMDTTKLMTGHYGNEGALQVTINVLKQVNQRDLACQLEKNMGKLKEQSLPKADLRKEANQGDKLKDLLTCGANSLGIYDRFVVVVNKSSPHQVQHLQFLNKLKLFSVLDFDPNSAALGGLCHSYRESRVANLHFPSQYKGQPDLVIKKLNLCKQTSWVFCNGRHDLDSDSDKELDYKNWLRKSCKDVEDVVSFICNPEVLLHGRSLIIFLLLSPVDTEKNPIFDTYRSFLKNIKEERMITICESQSTFKTWRKLIQEKCDFDIDPLSIYELTLSEVCGTIMALGPFSQSSVRLLPSSDSSAVVLKQKDEDFMTVLDILCLNQCENVYDEKSPEFQHFRVKVEEEFYRGGKVKWWNFYFCDKDKEKSFIKRDKYENVKKMIRSQLKDSSMCVLLNLFHDPGCGGTTLAMHVMWDLRKKFRCAVLKDNTHPKEDVASQVIQLMKPESEKPSPVLLLVDDSKKTENTYDLVNCIREAVVEASINLNDQSNCKVIILNCVRSHNPKEQYRRNPPQSQYLTAKLTPEEKTEFEKKLKELEETHEKPENFYSFMIMKNNFDQSYTDDLARNTLDKFDFSLKEAQLFAFLALLNTYVAKSEISLSLCEDFFGMKMFCWPEDSILDRMTPYSNFLIIDAVEEGGGYKGIRILHHYIASACLEELEKRYYLKLSDIVREILHCDLFFSFGVVKHRFMLSFQQMLIVRQRKKDGKGRELFSPLIYKLNSQEGRQVVQEIFEKASSRFVMSASIPQALARFLYINECDFPEALKWAEKAKNIKENPYTVDTIGRIHKSNLQSNIQREKMKTSINPEDFKTNIKIADNAIRAFKRAQELADTEDEVEKSDEEEADDESDDYPRKSYNVYGYVGVLEIAFLIFEILGRLPFFDESNQMKKKYLQGFLQKKMPITSVHKEDNETNNRYMEIILEHEKFLVNLKPEVKESFGHLERYFTYIKGNNSEFDSKNRLTVSELLKKYVSLFCSTSEEIKKERQNNRTLNLKIDIEERRLFLEEKQADTFAGILQHLDKPVEEIEKVTECYAFLHQQQQFIDKKQKTKETINYILSNVVLYILKPKSGTWKHGRIFKQLPELLLKTLQDVGLRHPFPDPYYLALLLFWPSRTQENPDLMTYVTAIRKSHCNNVSKSLQKRSTVAHLYLGKEEGLKRLVSKPQLDEHFKGMRRDVLAQHWRTGNIFKDKAIINRLCRVSGTIEEGEVFANYGKLKIPVRPALGGIRSGFSIEKVSFYLGFAINGPLAYDIQYEN